MRKSAFLFLLLLAWSATGQENLFRNAAVSVSSSGQGLGGSLVVDGDCSRKSTWMSAEGSRGPHSVELTLPVYARLDSIVVHTGIDVSERTAYENSKAAGFWNMKNFILQYWDDANWSDIPGTEVTENRLDRRPFVFSTPIVSFRFRIWCTDGEPIRLREVEGFGSVDGTLKVPEVSSNAAGTVKAPSDGVVDVTVSPQRTGHTMKYVGYNFAHFIPGGNEGIWWEYSSANLARVWANLEKYAPVGALHDFGPVNSLEDFERVKAEFLSGDYIPFEVLSKQASAVQSYNHLSLENALLTLKELGSDVIIQSSIPKSYYNTDWATMWEMWQRFFCQVYYCARTAGVHMFALQNEPNHRSHGPMPLDTWIRLSRIAADALDCAVARVNSETGSSLKGQFVGPVTAGTNFDWWSELARRQRTDYLGNVTGEDVVDIFSTHSYNSPAAGYRGRVAAIDNVLKSNHPEGRTIPVVFTEIGRWMGAYYADKEDDNNSPSVFTEWAGIYTQNTLAGCHGMCAFKFGGTGRAMEPPSKQGYHYIWNGKRWAEDAFENLAKGASADASGSASAAGLVIDSDKTTAWECGDNGPKWVSVDFGKTVDVGGMVLYTGSACNPNTAPDRAVTFHAEYRRGGKWKTVPKTAVKDYRCSQAFLAVEPPVRTDAVRIVIDDEGPAKVRELKVFGPGTLSRAQESYDIAAILKNAHVVRLFAKGFKDGRPLFRVERSVEDDQTDILASEDKTAGKKYLWLVRRNDEPGDLRIDLSALGCGRNTVAMLETVSQKSPGEACIAEVTQDGVLEVTLPAMSVSLVTLSESRKRSEIRPRSWACVRLDGGSGKAAVEMNQSDPSRNSVCYVSFKLSPEQIRNAGGIMLSVPGSANTDGRFRFNVYGFEGSVGKKLTWSEAPHLSGQEPLSEGFSSDFFVAGEMSTGRAMEERGIDVTDALKRRGLEEVTFMFIRELREPGDDYDNGIRAGLSLDRARLTLW